MQTVDRAIKLILISALSVGFCVADISEVSASETNNQSIPEERQGALTENQTLTEKQQGAIIQNQTMPEASTSNSAPLQGKVERKHASGFGLFGKRWTSEVYRSLNYGILGVVMVRYPFSKTERVSRVFPDCPAALAGIKAGDIVVKYADHVVDGHENQRITWHTADGIAGTHVDYTVRRHGQLLTFDLIRMNIEDVPNSSIRRMYERMLRDLGPPGVAEEKLQERRSEE